MGDRGASRPVHPPTDESPDQARLQQHQHQHQQQQQQHPFHAQLGALSTPQYNNVPQPYNMSTLVGALPPMGPPRMQFDPGPLYPMQRTAQYTPPRGPPYFDPMALRVAQQQQQKFYGSAYPQQQAHHIPAQPLDPYAYAMAFHSLDPRYGVQPGMGVAGPMPGLGPDFSRRPSDPAPVPSFPRGPPRKPKQSGHALWVGNLPPAANILDLKDHFSRDARTDIESLFLISKSNCAFVNYRFEAACVSAMNRFHDSRFHGVRLVCRLRRGSTSTNATPSIPETSQRTVASPGDGLVETTPTQDRNEPVIVGHTQTEDFADTATAACPSASIPSATKEPAKYYIVKSLTVEDLEASVRNGTWATQSHNERALTDAFEQAENVFLIFSANKSGEYFGYARMTSQISGEPVNLGTMVESDEVGTPQSIPTAATETAPKGRIIDDSARGTIFWEADLSDEQTEDRSPAKQEVDHGFGGQNWGRQFQIEWMSTARVPFFRTRGLRNPWNANREVKIARDGTELEPSIGLRLVQMFHPPAAPAQHADHYG